jgi:hypothetical protein
MKDDDLTMEAFSIVLEYSLIKELKKKLNLFKIINVTFLKIK